MSFIHFHDTYHQRVHRRHSFISMTPNHPVMHTNHSFIHFHDTHHPKTHTPHSFISMPPTTQRRTPLNHSFPSTQLPPHSFISVPLNYHLIHSFPCHPPPKDAHTSFIHFHATHHPKTHTPQSFISMPLNYHLIHSFPCHSTTTSFIHFHATQLPPHSFISMPPNHPRMYNRVFSM